MKKHEAINKLLENMVKYMKKQPAFEQLVAEYEKYINYPDKEKEEMIKTQLEPYETYISTNLELLLRLKGINVENVEKEVVDKIKEYLKALIEVSQ